jgi:hypothetical protein
MIEVADILRRHGAAYRQQHRLLPSQQKVLEDLVRCRTPAAGGQLYRCDHCGQEHYSYHSCRNRHCPKCHGEQTERWLERQRDQLLPCPYYLLTFTLPAGLRGLCAAHQKALYGLLLRSAAAALQKLAWDPRYVGGRLAMLAVLHTWTRALLYHPHVHLLVSAGGLSADGQHWRGARHPAFLVPCFALSKIFRGKFRAGLKRLGYLDAVPAGVWKKDWVVHCQHAGAGQKVLDYLGRYVFRIAICNSRIERFQDGEVTFRYRDNRCQQIQHVRLSALQFIGRFLQHVLPRGLVKVRSYGLIAAPCADKLAQACAHLEAQAPPCESQPLPAVRQKSPPPAPNPPLRLCPQCQCGHLFLIASLLPQRTRAP